MALGTYTKTDETGNSPSDPQPRLMCSFVLDNSYPTGGYPGFAAFIQAQTGRDTIITNVSGFGDPSGGGAAYVVEYVASTDCLKVRLGTTLVEVTAATDLHTVTVNATIWSK